MSGGFRSRSKSGDRPQPERGAKAGRADRAGKPREARAPRHNRGRDGAGGRERDSTGDFFQQARRSGADMPRAVAYEVVHRVNVAAAFANLVLPKALRTQRLEGRDAAFATELTYGTLRTQGVLDAVIAKSATRGLGDIAPEVLDALRLGTYQVLYTRVEPHAAVDTTVRLVEAAGQEKAKGFANGIMRTITRTRPEQWIEKLTPAGEIPAAAFRHAHPTWIAESFARVLGLGELDEALAADSERPIVHLVARPGEITAEELAAITGFEQGKYSPYAVYMDSGDPGSLEPVRQGLAAVQDEGSQLIARALVEAPVEGEDGGRWLDLCAGPGGKAALIGALARTDQAHVDAVEITAHRAELIEKTVADLPVSVHVADGRNPGLEPGFDRVLVDAPCSGLGSLRRRPEARWRKSEEDLAGLNTLQYELLSSALNLVRPGGVVIYSTCSPDKRETRDIVERAVSELGAQELDAHALIPDMPEVGHEKSVQMWPHRHGTDAMFFAVLRRGGPSAANEG
ncbi:RsmB/NOP family class I SAM-dependent RNA methyltransferase [Corynebacterium flavescens]|uniref:RsmB/NOP family class I SAM-dependent RNA methyltransferase n=3 Tax=Corynebacterium flavescens TaxID=28028 RepID=UPI002649BF59|nr:transcription antitermination factor NusB [Corynebacterium flavescens]MDN6199531.1 MFS transporter [Corynebacterium flavescens]MDN6227523.1 MFS transporter [Corynebacterium flavescens]MDN6430524.1 MFS transporter [Corynebacterium flavescens]MDN6460497.1 MFS transporter [Corynebacterium flavescens]MDN6475731.1 MFS transporter [Corynebacterium flavescens]